MKRILFFLVVLLLVGTDSLVLAQAYYRYNPYNPYSHQGNPAAIAQPPTPAQEKNIYDRDLVTSPYFTNPYDVMPLSPMYEDRDFYDNSYRRIPRRWYDSQANYPGTFEKNIEDPRKIADPYKDFRPYSQGELTNPYVGITAIPQGPGGQAMTQQLTPPELKQIE